MEKAFVPDPNREILIRGCNANSAEIDFIICSDKGNREKIDTKIVSYYSFTPIEMSQLKKNDIQSIRFTIKGIATKFNSQIGNFTAINKKEYFATYDNSPKSYNTATEIKAL